MKRIAVALETLVEQVRRVADGMNDEAPEAVVDTPYLAKRLGCTVTWVAEMARKGQIPKSCLVPGTGNGKPWKFHRERIEDWLNKR